MKWSRSFRAGLSLQRHKVAGGVLLLLCLASFAEPEPTEPTVTREEQELIEQAMGVAATNAQGAVKMLSAEINEETSAALDFAVGTIFFQADELEGAARAYTEAVRKLPTFRAALVNLGQTQLLVDDAGGAVITLTRVVRQGWGDVSTYKLLGHALLSEGMSVAAENAFRQVLLLAPTDADGSLGLAKCLLEQQRYAEGLAMVEGLLKNEPQRRELWSLRASLYLAMDRTDDALYALETARRLRYATPDMLATLGDLYVNRGQPEEAAARYAAAFAGKSPPIGRLLRAAEGFLLNDEPEHAESLLKVVKRERKDAGPTLTRAEARLCRRLEAELARRGGELDLARTLYETMLRDDPLDGEALLRLGDLHRTEGRLQDALAAYERTARLEGREAQGFVRQAQVEVERGRYSRAVELLESSLVYDDTPRVRRYLEQVRRLAELTGRDD